MTYYNTKNKNDLIETLNEKAIDLDNLFVADNLRMIGCDKHDTRMLYYTKKTS